MYSVLNLVEILEGYILFSPIVVLSIPETFVSHANSRTNGAVLSTGTFYDFYGPSDGFHKMQRVLSAGKYGSLRNQDDSLLSP